VGLFGATLGLFWVCLGVIDGFVCVIMGCLLLRGLFLKTGRPPGGHRGATGRAPGRHRGPH